MSRNAKRATTALLCAVVLVAFGLALLGLPESTSTPESLRLNVTFDPFQPGVTQTRTSAVDVPVTSRVDAARIEAIGSDTIDVDLTICEHAACEPLAVGTELGPGSYVLRVAATLREEMPPGSSSDLIGEIRIVEIRRQAMADPSRLIAFAAAGALAIAVGALTVRRRRGATA